MLMPVQAAQTSKGKGLYLGPEGTAILPHKLQQLSQHAQLPRLLSVGQQALEGPLCSGQVLHICSSQHAGSGEAVRQVQVALALQERFVRGSCSGWGWLPAWPPASSYHLTAACDTALATLRAKGSLRAPLMSLETLLSDRRCPPHDVRSVSQLHPAGAELQAAL